MSREQAELSYGKWTNTLLTRWRTYASRKGQEWYYVQVTERQTRGHPHSHILTTWKPPDIVEGLRSRYVVDNSGVKRKEAGKALRSKYIEQSCISVGLGDQYDISRVASVEGASRYVAKYLFKPTIFNTKWPSGWKRVRYSNSFPKREDRETVAFVLMTREDWWKLARLATVITTDSDTTKSIVYNALGYQDITIK